MCCSVDCRVNTLFIRVLHHLQLQEMFTQNNTLKISHTGSRVRSHREEMLGTSYPLFYFVEPTV